MGDQPMARSLPRFAEWHGVGAPWDSELLPKLGQRPALYHERDICRETQAAVAKARRIRRLRKQRLAAGRARHALERRVDSSSVQHRRGLDAKTRINHARWLFRQLLGKAQLETVPDVFDVGTTRGPL